ncbi:MAG TPA: VOC family protein [Candidatus Limnocylindria bacterium]|nr:VOC family protein [Candidatus Limnocylindria bacterium]
MIEAYLAFDGNAGEALAYYQEVFGAPKPYVMREAATREAGSVAEAEAGPILYANLKTPVGDLMLSDTQRPGRTPPGSAYWLMVTHGDEALLREYFDRLARDGEALEPLARTFFSPLYGEVRDRFGYCWIFMLPSTLPVPEQP